MFAVFLQQDAQQLHSDPDSQEYKLFGFFRCLQTKTPDDPDTIDIQSRPDSAIYDPLAWRVHLVREGVEYVSVYLVRQQ